MPVGPSECTYVFAFQGGRAPTFFRLMYVCRAFSIAFACSLSPTNEVSNDTIRDLGAFDVHHPPTPRICHLLFN